MAVLALLFAAPLALGAVHEPAFIPLLIIGSTVGIVSWLRGHWVRTRGGELPEVPGQRTLLALHVLVLFQLVPMPSSLLWIVSSGSFKFYDRLSLVPLSGWRPISVNPADTLRGFAFLAGMTLLYAAVFREFRDDRWRRRLGATVVAAGFVLTVVALIQQASAEPTRIYGLWKPMWDWAVFGPYVSRNHFAGYLAMAIPVACGFAAEALVGLRKEWALRPRGWIALGGPAGNAAIRRCAAAMVLLVGLLASGSRGGLMAAAVSFVAIPVAFRGRGRVVIALALLMVFAAGVAWVDMSTTWEGFRSRGIKASRVDLWMSALPMVRDFPVFGSGFDTFGTAYEPYQPFSKYHWYGEVHNEYLQALLDLGVVGAALTGGLLWLLARSARRAAANGAFDAGILGAITACCAHNIVEFNWQIPANAATFAALAGIAVRQAVHLVAVDSPRDGP